MFTDEQRLVFTYKVGERVIHADPLDLRRRLIRASAGEFYRLLDRAAAPEVAEGEKPPPEGPAELALRAEAEDKLLAVIRDAFRLPPWDESTGQGALDSQCWEALNTYHRWLEGNARRGGNSPKS